MSDITYKKIVDVEQIEALSESTTLFVNDGGSMKQVAANKFGAIKSIDGITPDETGNIKYWRSNPIPFSKNGNTLKCIKPFAEAIEIASSGTNQANVTLAISALDTSTMILATETKYASSVIIGLNVSTSEIQWLQADFDMDDGSVIRLRLNPDESVTETIIQPDSSAGAKQVIFDATIDDESGEYVATCNCTFEEVLQAVTNGNAALLRYQSNGGYGMVNHNVIRLCECGYTLAPGDAEDMIVIGCGFALRGGMLYEVNMSKDGEIQVTIN